MKILKIQKIKKILGNETFILYQIPIGVCGAANTWAQQTKISRSVKTGGTLRADRHRSRIRDSIQNAGLQ